MWAAYLRQVAYEGWVFVVLGTVSLVGVGVITYRAIRYVQENGEGTGVILVGVVSLIVSVILLSILTEGIMRFINPTYYAIKLLLDH